VRILITGSDGYLGSLLAPELLKSGHEVIGLDVGYYLEGVLFRSSQPSPLTIHKDLRQLSPSDLHDIDAVVHMAELSNDPVGQLAPDITYAINHQGSVHLAKIAKAASVRRFIYMSSCSVYGVSEAELVDEESPVNPQTTYAVCKTLVERDLSLLADDNFSPVFMRNATAYGPSPHMRFDIVLNNLSGLAWTTREIRMTSDGTPWRPIVHALDICRAIKEALIAPLEAIHNQVFNVGDTSHNYRIRQIAETVATVFPGCRLAFGRSGSDHRSYRVSFEKIREHLPNFRCEWNAERGARQLYDLFQRIDMPAEVFQHRAFTRLKQIEYLRRTKQIDEHFFWTEPCVS